MKRFDMTVIGGGPGGYVAALRGTQLGLSVALVEKDRALGGTCLLRGCIPTKAMLHDADVWAEVKAGGLLKGSPEFDWAKVTAHRDEAIEVNSKGVAYLMKKAGVTVFRGHGRLAGAGRVDVQLEDGMRESLESAAIVLATGSAPRMVPGVAVDERRIVTSNGCLELDYVPKRMVVLGSGAVGIEFASIFQRFGADVTVVELLPRIVPNEDEDVSEELARHLRKQGMKIHTESKVTKAEVSGDAVTIEVAEASGSTLTMTAEVLLVAVGRRPVTEGLGLEEAGIAMERGFVLVDEQQRTNTADIYAIGDIVPGPQLAHKASADGIAAAEAIAGIADGRTPRALIPGATYCSPEIGSIGLTEAQAREQGYEVRVGKFPFSANGRARIEHLPIGFVKIVSEARYDEVLGVHIVGPHATELIGEACVAMRLEATTEELARTIHAHPTVSEAIGEAAHALLGQAIHI